MKYNFGVFLVLVTLLSSCVGNTSEQEQSVILKIPDEYNLVEVPSEIRVDGTPVTLQGELLGVGDILTDTELDLRADYFNEVESKNLSEFGSLKLIQTVPSLDTPVCTFQTQQLEAAAEKFRDVTFITLSHDTPFALQRFCAENSIDNLITLSDARTREFGIRNNFFLPEYGLLSRSIMIVDEDLEILYIEYAEEVTHELNLENALAFMNTLRN